MRIFNFDMDGVMVDFDLHANNLGVKRDENGEVNWEELYNNHPTFFNDIPVMEGIYELWDMIPVDQRRILSAVAKRVDNCGEQKRQSLKRHFNIEGEKVVLVRGRKNKIHWASPGDILIDDRQDNIDDWNNSGGIGILFESVQQTIEDLKKYL